VLITAISVMAITGVVYAATVTNTMNYTAKLVKKGKPSAKKPAPLTYTGTLHIDTVPPGQQPDIGPRTTLFFAKGIINHAKDFPFCDQSEIDGQPTIPAKCNKAIVGTGTATAYAGQPGADRSKSVKEDLDVKAINGTKGTLYLVVTTVNDRQTGAPPAVPITNRVIPGTFKKGSGAFGFLVQFDIPETLQTQVGLSISLTDFSVTLSGQARTLKVKGKSVKESYLALTACKGSVPVKAITQFKDSNGAITPVTSESTAKC
jgi:hypothetical protein